METYKIFTRGYKITKSFPFLLLSFRVLIVKTLSETYQKLVKLAILKEEPEVYINCIEILKTRY